MISQPKPGHGQADPIRTEIDVHEYSEWWGATAVKDGNINLATILSPPNANIIHTQIH